MSHRTSNTTAHPLLVLLPITASAEFTIVSRSSELQFNGTNFGNTDQLASSASLSDPFDAIFSDAITHQTPSGENSGTYSLSQHDSVSATLLRIVRR